jgi:protein PhnA
MSKNISERLKERSESLCELCVSQNARVAYAVSPKNNDTIDNEVALCDTCVAEISNKAASWHWSCLAGSIWNQAPSVQALSYRILYSYKDEQWASEIMSSVELPEQVINWALSIYQVQEIHTDSNGDALANGDTVVLTQQLNIKGASFNVPKGTIVRKIRLVPSNTEQIEGKINDQVIVILTKFVRKS